MKVVLVTVLAALYIVSSVDARWALLDTPVDYNLKHPLPRFMKRIDNDMLAKNMEMEKESEAYLAMVDKLLKDLNEQLQKILDEAQTEMPSEEAAETGKEQSKTNAVRKRKVSEVEEDEDDSMQADEPVENDSSEEFDDDMAANAFLAMLMHLSKMRSRQYA